jgi:hypothetical protein
MIKLNKKYKNDKDQLIDEFSSMFPLFLGSFAVLKLLKKPKS